MFAGMHSSTNARQIEDQLVADLLEVRKLFVNVHFLSVNSSKWSKQHQIGWSSSGKLPTFEFWIFLHFLWQRVCAGLVSYWISAQWNSSFWWIYLVIVTNNTVIQFYMTGLWHFVTMASWWHLSRHCNLTVYHEINTFCSYVEICRVCIVFGKCQFSAVCGLRTSVFINFLPVCITGNSWRLSTVAFLLASWYKASFTRGVWW